MPKEGFHLLSKMNIKYWILVGVLILGIVFLVMDKCSSPSRVDKLKGEYKKASEIAKVERLRKEEIIKKQNKIIKEQDTKIKEQVGTIQTQNKKLTEKEKELGDLKRDFESLEECQAQYDKLVKGFTLAIKMINELGVPIEYYDEQGVKRIKYPRGSLTFKLNEKYESQLIISNNYKTMNETLIQNTKKLEGIVTAQDWQIKKLKLASGVKTGIVVTMAGVVLYSLLKD